MRFLPLLVLAACVDVYGSGSDKAGDENSDGDDLPEEGTPASDGLGDTCPSVPDGCVSLAEAVDRGWARIDSDAAAVLWVAVTDVEVCTDGWYTFISEDSQDASAGTYVADTIEAGESYPMDPEGPDATDLGEWWCVELPQNTQPASFDFDGAHMAPPIVHFLEDETDEDGDGTEDHDEDVLGVPQTQQNIWAYEDENPLIVVGRESNYVQVDVGDQAEVILRVTNLGREDGTATITERVPAGYVASGFTSSPLSSTFDSSDGSTSYTFSVSLRAAIDPVIAGDPTDYDIERIHYFITPEESGCAGRTTGFAPEADWADLSADSWTSEGSALVLECCADGDGSSNDPWP
jgi:hypothetical protein